MTEELLTSQQVADYLKVPVATLHNWRWQGSKMRGPVGFKVGRHVRYQRSDVDDWVMSQRAADRSAS